MYYIKYVLMTLQAGLTLTRGNTDSLPFKADIRIYIQRCIFNLITHNFGIYRSKKMTDNKEFSIGLFDIGDCKSCLFSWFCPNCALAASVR